MDKIKSRFNSFSGKITLIVMLGISLIAVTVSFVVLVMSRQVFTKNYGDSQEKVFEQIEKEFNDFHDHIQNVFDAIDSSWAFRLYFNETPELDNTQTFQNVYQMEQDLEKSKSADMERLNILVVGYNGKHYLSRTENICVTDQEILQSEPTKKALSDPDVIHYTYTGQAYTTTSRNADTLIISKALYYHESREVYAIAFVTLTMEELKQYYNYFVSDTTSFYLVDDHEIVLCSDRPGITGTHLQEEWFEKIKNADELRMPMLTNVQGEPDLLNMILQSAGISVFDEDGKISLVNNDGLKEAMNVYMDLINAGILQEQTDWSGYQGSINNGTVVGTINGSWICATITSTDQAEQEGNWAVTNMPKLNDYPGATNYSAQGGSTWAISSSSKNYDLAVDFFKTTWAGSTEFYDNILSQLGAIATYLPAADSDAYNQVSDYFGGEAIYSKIVSYGSNIPTINKGIYWSEEKEALGTALTNVLNGSSDLDSAIEEAQATIEFNIGQ